MEPIKLTCINCPLGCSLEVTRENEKYVVSGNNCLRGKHYALQEITNPVRIITTTVKVKNNSMMLSVKSNGGIAKDKILDCINILKDVEAVAPIEINDVIVSNILDSGVDIIATKTIEGDKNNG